MKKLKKHFFSKLAKLHKRNSDRPQMYNLKGITSDGKVVDFPYISADKCGVINIAHCIKQKIANRTIIKSLLSQCSCGKIQPFSKQTHTRIAEMTLLPNNLISSFKTDVTV